MITRRYRIVKAWYPAITEWYFRVDISTNEGESWVEKSWHVRFAEAKFAVDCYKRDDYNADHSEIIWSDLD